MCSEIMKKYNYNKSHVRYKRRMAKKFKEKEVIKNSYFQTKCDRLKSRLEKKGVGRQKKIKGEILPQPICSNSKELKQIRYNTFYKPIKTESVKHLIIAIENNL